uniref:Cullin family profile domain-containing protein n=1 Tax=Acrobeloides nanus TaxID=290746 RepID=A0A914E9S7_9BILA
MSYKHSDSSKIKQYIPKRMDDEEAEQKWKSLKKAINAVHARIHVTMSFEEYYCSAYAMVTGKQGEMLYRGFCEVISEHLIHQIRPLFENAINENFLETLDTVWTKFNTETIMIRDLLMYVDRSFVDFHRPPVKKLYDVALDLFREIIVDYPTINDQLKAFMLNCIAQERQYAHISWIHLKSACQMLHTLSSTTNSGNKRYYYEQVFEGPFLRETQEYYQTSSQKFLEENSTSVYVKKVRECFKDEESRSDRYLDDETMRKVFKILREELIRKNMQILVNNGLVDMINNEKYMELRDLYELLKEVENGLNLLADSLGEFLRHQISYLNEENTEACSSEQLTIEKQLFKPIAFIQSILDVKDQFDTIISRAFNNDTSFRHRIRTEFEKFLNGNKRSPEFLSLYIDEKLRKGFKEVRESEVDLLLDKIVNLFRHLQEKDVFERYYKIHLSKRLIFNKTSNMDYEKSVISKLRDECGAIFTMKLEGMFKDMGTSADLMEEYKNTPQFSSSNVEFSVQVLTAVNWPYHATTSINIPLNVLNAFETFKDYYLGKHSGRKLDLLVNQGYAELNAYFYGSNKREEEAPSQLESQPYTNSSVNSNSSLIPTRKYQLIVNTYTMVVLLCFNEREKLSFKQLLDETKIPEKELVRVLQSLSMGKTSMRVLCRQGKNKEIESADEFWLNDGFSSKLKKVRIQMISNRNCLEKEPTTREKVEEDRRHEVEAAIVRIMKARKILSHSELIVESTNQLKARFNPDPILIKRRIENLIERDYLKRDDQDQKLYHYIT